MISGSSCVDFVMILRAGSSVRVFKVDVIVTQIINELRSETAGNRSTRARRYIVINSYLYCLSSGFRCSPKQKGDH